MTFSRLPEFLTSADAVQMHLKFGDTDQDKQDSLPNQSNLILLHPVFSHISLMLIQTLSETGHGEFVTRSKQGNHEATIEMGGHISYRYRLKKEELEEIKQIYDQVLKTWIIWKLSQKKT
ncbi:hypothetical protein G7B40_014450 [Aetokthonos hydrillicola Thurmond2011]|jgi:hypothetical protein|uniref:Uncharacterized protein n=1 Tax=Aetokthonos hydrillicola Thurmond2011 TaxID=2712845 RepID=A0AAP5M9H7_9CYAN|nr:hypothetical protein [Aetokthonos hydrillicola]MBW4589916.1 hypothetical protein [Aetokthonos hydrillicola CCALA 1050]MDR9895757.1 hypothetical protein [Aetokthonos hydrillicola Thurmond2011]